MKQIVEACNSLRGTIVLPGDKSISHRAIILNAISGGNARISNLSPSADVHSTIQCMKMLGVDIRSEPDATVVHGRGPEGLAEAEDILYAGNSGTTARLLTGLLAAQPFLSIITGDESLRSRPMDRIIEPLGLMGADIRGRNNNRYAPLSIRGTPLHGITYRLPVASAQVKSAIILAALFARGETIIEEPSPSRDHTERMLTAMGANLVKTGSTITVTPGTEPLASLSLTVPGDISAAAFWLVAGSIHPDAQIKLTGVGINPTRDGIIDVLQQMGARISIENRRIEGGEPVADLSVESSHLAGTTIEGDSIPRLIDEILVIAVAASVARGTTMIRDAAELKVKETNRIDTTVKELSRLGVDIKALPDGMQINGGGHLHGAECDSHGDHRLAMALGVAGLIADGQTMIYNAEAVTVSYPGFWSDLETLSRK